MNKPDSKPKLPVIAVIDNYDSFTYNLVQMIAALGADMRVFRNDAVSVDQLLAMEPDGLVVSPGPGYPDTAGISVESIRRCSGKLPLLGVCLGHQSLAVAFGGKISGARRIMHGKTSMITYTDSPLYAGLKNPFPAGRYHSLAAQPETLPLELIVDATSEDGELMGMHHSSHPSYGVQFHPESVLTPSGKRLLRNFLDIVEQWDNEAAG
jgi:anthranilate synthase component 2